MILTSPTLLQTSVSQAQYYIWYFGKEHDWEVQHVNLKMSNDMLYHNSEFNTVSYTQV